MKKTPLKRYKPSALASPQEAFKNGLKDKSLAKKRTPLKDKGKVTRRNEAKLRATGHTKDDSCQRCGSIYKLEDHHILFRARVPCLVAEPLNLVTICGPFDVPGTCHYLAHNSEAVFLDWVEERYPGRLETLHALIGERSKSVIGRTA